MNNLQSALAAAGLVSETVPVVVSAEEEWPFTFVEKIRELNNPANFLRFVRRAGQLRDVLRFVSPAGVDYEVTLLTECAFQVAVTLPDRPAKYAVHYHYGEIATRRVVVNGVIADYRFFERALVNQLYDLVVKDHPQADDEVASGEGDGSMREHKPRRAHWRRLTGKNGWIAHSFPPRELLDIGVPFVKTGHTFVHEELV